MNRRRLVALAVVGVASVYGTAVRPRLLRWGATQQELAERFPGDVIEGAVRSATMATTIDTPPSRVWPWLVQMGTDRGGWYSWDHLDNFGRTSADRIHADWQDVSLGSRLRGTPDGRQSWVVAALEPERFLALRMSLDLRGRAFDPQAKAPRFYTDSTWSFLLKELPGGRTRLVVSGYWALRPGWLRPLVSVFLLEPSHWIMQMRQFSNLKKLAERGQTGEEVAKAPGAEVKR